MASEPDGSDPDVLRRRALRSSVLGALGFIVLIFGPAETLAWPQGWAFWATFVLASGAYTLDLARNDPELLARRMQGGPGHEREPAQRVIMVLLFIGFVILLGVPGIDHRRGWSHVPLPVSVLGDVLVAASFLGFWRVTRVNRFAAANIRVEPDQTVISTGPYARVRHPMYSASLLLLVGAPLALGSWWALMALILFLPALAWRILNEEQVLARDLAGYRDYMTKVRWRLVPGIW